MSTVRLINYIAFPVLLVAALWGLYWIWGLLFLWWLVPSIMAGQSQLVFEINRDDDAVLFWAVVVLWASLGVMMIIASLFPQFAAWLV